MRQWQKLIPFIPLLTVVTAAGAFMTAAHYNALPTMFIPKGNRTEAKKPRVLPIPSPPDFVEWALADALTLPEHQRPFTRYIARREGTIDGIRTTNFAMNCVSRAGLPLLPDVLAGFHLVRIYLPFFFPQEKDLIDVLTVWEDFSFDPGYNFLVTKGNIDLLERFHGISPEDLAIARRDLAKTDVIRFNGHNIKEASLIFLQSVLRSNAPVVDEQYFKSRALATIRKPFTKGAKDDKVFDTVFGGRYYNLRGIKTAAVAFPNKKDITDLDVYFDQLGIGNVENGLTTDKLFERVRGDQRTVVFNSLVTGNARDATMFYTPAVSRTSPWGAITGDVRRTDVDITQRSFANLLTPFRFAREAIFPGANGFHVFALFNGEGALQDEVPPDVAPDTTIPDPWNKELQPAIGCIRCHGIYGEDGWKPMGNDVRDRLVKDKRVDLLTDLNALVKARGNNADVQDQLVRRFQGDFNPPMQMARNSVAQLTLEVTGPWPDGTSQANIYQVTTRYLANEYKARVFDLVTARKALYELGLDVVEEADATKLLEVTLPPDIERSQFGTMVLEDPRIAILKNGGKELRTDWDLVYPFAAERFRRSVTRLTQQYGNQWYMKVLETLDAQAPR